MASPLEDLEELILRCREKKARLYIAEAVACYKAGAFRSAIVATWIAVCFDMIEKFRELALAGDKAAELLVKSIVAARDASDIRQAMSIERELLNVAKEKFELISQLEYIDLERLQADRNRCAHPSLNSEDQAYVPSAELARLHIHSAVTHLLQQAPAQGKYALDRLMLEIESDYFPTSSEAALVAFSSGPLRRPRESLVRNLLIVLAKILLKESPDWKRRARVSAAIQAIQELHPEQYSKTMDEILSSLFQAVPDTNLIAAIEFLRSMLDSWQYLDESVHQRLQQYVADLPSEYLNEIGFMLSYEPLKVQARNRVCIATKKELCEAMFLDLPTEVADRLIDLYLAVSSFDSANAWAKVMAQHTSDFTTDHVVRLITSIASNNQITGSFQISMLIENLRSQKKLPDRDFESLLRENGLAQYCRTPQRRKRRSSSRTA